MAHAVAVVDLGRAVGATDAASAARSWLERLEVADRASSKVKALSHGDQQRVQLAAALVHDPEALVLDESLAGLDLAGIEVVGQVLIEQAHAGRCVLSSNHQLDLVEDLCEPVAIIDHRRLIANEGVDDLTTKGAPRLAVRVGGIAREHRHASGAAYRRSSGRR